MKLKPWHVGGLVSGAILGGVGLARVLRRKPRWPSNWTTLGQPETEAAWTHPSAEPGVVAVTGPTRIPVPEAFWRLGLAVAGVSPEMARARINFTRNAPIRYWLEVVPKQPGTTSITIVDASGPLSHIALDLGVA